MSRTLALAKLRAIATGEAPQTALSAVRALSPLAPLIGQASDGQARMESLFLANLNNLDAVTHPTDPPFAIRGCTPTGHDIIVHIARPHASAVLNETLPHLVPGQDVRGVPGLRARHHRGFLVLEHLRLAGRIRIPLTHRQWVRSRSLLLAGLPAGTVVAWADHPRELLPAEEDSLAWRTESAPGAATAEAAQMMSALLRRLHLMRGTSVPGCRPFYDVWANSVGRTHAGARLVNLEWGSRPTSPRLAELLTDARSPVALPEALRVRTRVHGLDVPWVRIYAEHGNQLLLRHNPLETSSHPARVPDHGPHRPPRRTPAWADDLTALDMVVRALTGEYPALDRQALHVTRRSGGGWDLVAPGLHYGLLEHLRQVAHSRAYPYLWPADVHDLVSLYDQRSVARVRGVDFAFHDRTHG
ncbi:hypothetical protein BJF83_23185 [Nocardiopsis sp. CNR-923]|uniref:hypothetical protein n=1 Tax=Nocardiopsis sp. CNR-923 TaxID=1904965 RepID=UPI000967103F|nr:hypothetical protein [Nocardiopsis sp. CNR-923]OLT25310.1 hypothetical protein BJF83_23185 [Nocardiopsis sp. CNR-923]